MERAKALSSRDAIPLSPAEVLSKGVAFAASQLGILCRRPQAFIKLDGNCIWTSVCHAIDPTLQGAFLQQSGWELRVKALGTVIAMFGQLSEEEVEWLQAVSVKRKQTVPFSKEEIKCKLKSYMEGGQWSGELGDIIPQVVASYLCRPIMIIELTSADKAILKIVRPGVVFDCGEEEENAVPLMLILHLNHFVPLHIDQGVEETAIEKYKQWKYSANVNLDVEDSIVGNRSGSHGTGADRGRRRAASKRARSSGADDERGTQVRTF
jgi:hypothetical protein